MRGAHYLNLGLFAGFACFVAAVVLVEGYRPPPPGPPCVRLPDRDLFLTALARIRHRAISAYPSAEAGDSRPNSIVARHFRRFDTVGAFLDAHPDCCTIDSPHQYFSPTVEEIASGDWPQYRHIQAGELIAVQIKLRAHDFIDGVSKIYVQQLSVLVDGCGREFDPGKFGLSISGAHEFLVRRPSLKPAGQRNRSFPNPFARP